MKKQTKYIVGIGALILLYLYLKPKPKSVITNANKEKPTEIDAMKSGYSIVPLPDIKGYKFSSVMPTKVVGQNQSSPILIATSSKV
jgi:hypothetical protein